MLCFFAAGASQVKWNKKNANYLATSHDGDVRIWDKRVSDLSLVFSSFLVVGVQSPPEGVVWTSLWGMASCHCNQTTFASHPNGC